MNALQIQEMHDAFTPGVPLYVRTLAAPLKMRVWNLSIPAYGYKWIKRKMEGVASGEPIICQDGETPPPFVLDLDMKSRFRFEWRWRHLIKVQQRLSFWMEYTGESESELLAIAGSFGYKFLPEIVDESERRRKYNASREPKTQRLKISDIKDNYGNPLLEELRHEVLNTPIRKGDAAWHIFHITYGRGVGAYAVECDSRVRALRRLAYALNKSVMVVNYEKHDYIPKWIKKRKILEKDVEKWYIREGRIVGSSTAENSKVEDEEYPEKNKEEDLKTPEIGADDLL